jgi:hypothetical protein
LQEIQSGSFRDEESGRLTAHAREQIATLEALAISAQNLRLCGAIEQAKARFEDLDASHHPGLSRHEPSVSLLSSRDTRCGRQVLPDLNHTV